MQQGPVCTCLLSSAPVGAGRVFGGEDVAGGYLARDEFLVRAEEQDGEERDEEGGEDAGDDGFPDQALAAADARDEEALTGRCRVSLTAGGCPPK